MKVSMSLLSLVVVVALTMEGVSAQDWLKKWLDNRDNGNIKKASDSFQPTGVLEMLGYGTFGRRSRRSVDVKHKIDSTTETSEIENAVTSETHVAETSETDNAETSVTSKMETSISGQEQTSDNDKVLERWSLMCTVINAISEMDTDQGSSLSLKTFDAVFRIADKNKDGRMDAKELDLYEKLIEAYEICRMLA